MQWEVYSAASEKKPPKNFEALEQLRSLANLSLLQMILKAHQLQKEAADRLPCGFAWGLRIFKCQHQFSVADNEDFVLMQEEL